MQRKVFVASHGELSRGMVDSAKLICGDLPFETEIYSLKPGMIADEFATSVIKEVKADPDTEFVILTDLFGASVCNALYNLTVFNNVKLFSGMNLNMLLSIYVEYTNVLTRDDIDEIITMSKNGIKYIEQKRQQVEDF